MRKKVGVLSMQRIQNYGSFLQAFGLKSMLEELECDVQFVDYHPGKTLIPSSEGTGLRRKISKALDAMKGSAPFREKIRFIKYKKNYASNYYPYLGITEKRNYSPEVDLLIIGSDEVFNCVQDNTNVGFSPELFGQKRKAKKLISYAASFGNTTEEKLEQYRIEKKIKVWLKEFDAVSVRDKNSGELVKRMTGVEPFYHLDPVLMYEFKDIPRFVPKEKYLLLYGYSGRFSNEECRRIRAYAKRKELKIYCIGGIQNCCDRFIDVNPFEVIAYFQNAECVITDTFHGTILSVITHRQFVSIVRESGYGNSQKLIDLLHRLELEDRRILSISGLKKLGMKIDYEKTDHIIQSERAKTIDYLKNWIG